MGLRDRVTQPYIDAQERLERAVDLEARCVEFEARIEEAMKQIVEAHKFVEDAEVKVDAAITRAEAMAAAANARVDAIVARHEALIAKLEALVESKTPVRKAMVQAMVDEAVKAAVDARAAQQQESLRGRMVMSPSSMPYMLPMTSDPFGMYR